MFRCNNGGCEPGRSGFAFFFRPGAGSCTYAPSSDTFAFLLNVVIGAGVGTEHRVQNCCGLLNGCKAVGIST